MVAAIYFGLGVILVPFLLLGSVFGIHTGDSTTQDPMSPLMAIAMPPIYGIIGYLTTAAALWIYNLAARHGGGMELDIVYAVEPSPAPEHGASSAPSP